MASDTTFVPARAPLRAAIAARFADARRAGQLPGLGWTDRVAHWALRLPLVALLLTYGIDKFPAAVTDPTGFGVPAALFVLSAFAEVLGAVALVLGGIVQSWQPRGGGMRLAGDALTRAGGLAAVAAIGGVIGFFYWGSLYPAHPHLMMLGLAAYLMLRGNR
jgi:hypothetical protein